MDTFERSLGVTQFSGNDFASWKFRMEALLDEKKLIDHVDKTASLAKINAEPKNAAIIAWLDKDKEAKSLITRCVANSHISYLRNKTYAYEMWEALEQAYERKSVVSRIFLKKKLLHMVYKEDEPLHSYFAKFESAVYDLKAVGGKMEEEDIVMQLLISLPDSYDGLVMALENLPESELTMDRVKARLLEEELKRNSRKEPTDNGSGNAAFNAKKREPKKSNKSNKPRCYHCNEMGHKKPECPKLKSSSAAKKESKSGTFNMVIARTSSAMPTKTENECKFVVDSGCTDHMVNDKSLLVNVKKLDDPFFVSIADRNTTLKVSEVGRMKVTNSIDGREVTGYINDVLLVPNLRFNLLSVSKIESNGGRVIFENSKAMIAFDNEVVGEAVRDGSLYWISYNVDRRYAAVSSKATNELWHQRLGHLSMDSVCKLKHMADGIPDELTSDLDFCECCKISKMTRQPFTGGRAPTTRPLERVHSDVCGPINPGTHDGYRYFVTFIDDYTHMCVVYLLRRKDEVFVKFKEFHAMATSHFNVKMSNLRTDNGGEYISRNMKDFCKENGIILDPTTPYTPECNGVSERMNRTLCEKARSMLIGAGLPKHLWGEAVLTAVFLTNRSPTNAVKGATPYQLWFDKKPNLSKLRIFGSPAVMHVPKEKRLKLDQTGVSAVFVGYGSNGYRLWRPDLRKVVCSRDVYINESSPKVICEEMTEYQPMPVDNASTEDDEPNLSVGDDDDFHSANDQSEEVITEPTSIAGENDCPDLNPSQQPADVLPPRNRRPPERFGDYVMNMAIALNACVDDAPTSFKDIEGRQDEAEWRSAVDEELKSLERNKTWQVVKPPPKVKLIGTKWIFKRKPSDDGAGYRCRARLVAKGFMQREGVDYSETYAPVARLPTVRLLLSIGVQFRYKMIHLDVRTAFLHGNLDEEIYMKVPEGVRVPDGCALRLHKSLYGLKQSQRCWNNRFDAFMTENGFTRSKADYCLYWKQDGDAVIIVVLYVDDMLICSNAEIKMNQLKVKLFNEFDMKDLGPVKNFMGIQIERDDDQLLISQSHFIDAILSRFGMTECNPVATPMEAKLKLEKAESDKITQQPYRELLGCLMYLLIGSRPDICFALNYLSRFQDKASDQHWIHLKRILRYLKGTKDQRLVYQRHVDAPPIEVYTDSDFANDDDGKSTTGYIIKVFGNTITWCSKKQSIIALSSTEAEYIAACAATCEMLWALNVLTDLKINVPRPIPIYEDNRACILISKNLATKRTRHYKTKLLFLRELAISKQIELVAVSTKDQIADTLTKSLPREAFEKFRFLMGLKVRESDDRN